MVYRFIEDAGHGWLEVMRSEVYSLGIAPKISRYSYERGDKVYLEEDCDASRFITAKKEKGEPVEMTRIYQETSPIRNYESWGGV